MRRKAFAQADSWQGATSSTSVTSCSTNLISTGSISSLPAIRKSNYRSYQQEHWGPHPAGLQRRCCQVCSPFRRQRILSSRMLGMVNSRSSREHLKLFWEPPFYLTNKPSERAHKSNTRQPRSRGQIAPKLPPTTWGDRTGPVYWDRDTEWLDRCSSWTYMYRYNASFF